MFPTTTTTKIFGFCLGVIGVFIDLKYRTAKSRRERCS
uniref:Mitogen-activated protein kinase kinase 2 isoform X2 n=1 Tax=Rhizophora mucronata TaxID=61149 RepID=A0A2P2LA80_RHIMU